MLGMTTLTKNDLMTILQDCSYRADVAMPELRIVEDDRGGKLLVTIACEHGERNFAVFNWQYAIYDDLHKFLLNAFVDWTG